jgi:hypothetical protein
MKIHRFWTLGVLIAVLLAALAAATSAAAAPVTVNLRIEGSSSTIFEGPVTTDAKTIDGHPCDGTNGGANSTPGPTMTSALDDASTLHGFPWSGTWFDSFQDFGIDSIGPDASNSSQFWGYADNWQSSSVGGCQQELQNGDSVLFGFDYFSKSHLLQLTGPATAQVGQPVALKVVDGQDGSAISGASVGGATTAADGTASVTYSSPGVVQLKAERSDSIRSNALDVCVYASSSSECGPPPPPANGVAGVTIDKLPPSVALKGIKNHKHFHRHRGPRTLRGAASDAGGLFQVYFRLRRFTHHGCQWYSAKRSVFTRRHRHCKARYQRVGSKPTWSYLLPKRLPKGSYILDTKAIDKAFNRARTRVKFSVAR